MGPFLSLVKYNSVKSAIMTIIRNLVGFFMQHLENSAHSIAHPILVASVNYLYRIRI